MVVSITPSSSSPTRSPVAYEFGPFRLEPAEQRLTQDGRPVLLPHRAFEMLVFLVERSGRLVTKEELLEGLWSGLFVEEGNLSQNVFLLRRALTNGPADPGYIETVPRRGYRFIGLVTKLPAEPGSTSTRSSEPSPQGPANRTFRLRRAALAVAGAAAVLLGAGVSVWLRRQPAAPPAAGVRSIAVLPLKPFDEAAGDGLLGLGIAEAVVSRLSRRPSLLVRPLSSSRQAMLAGSEAAAVGARLGVDCVLEGMLQRSGGRVRATVELVRVRDRRVLWSDSFEEPAAEAFHLEDSISERLVGALGQEIGLPLNRRKGRPMPANQAAYDSYVRGRIYWNRRGASDLERSVQELEEAVRQDPNYALAWSGLADTYVLLGPSSTDGFPRARAAAEKALGLDPDLAEAHASLGFTRFFSDWDFAGSERELRRALELDPGYATAHQWYAYWLAAAGRFEAAVAEMQRARDIDPLSLVLREDVGHILIYARRYPEAIAELRQVMSLDPSFSKLRIYLVQALLLAGRYDEAAGEIRRLDGWPDDVQVRAWDARLAAARGRVEEARAFAPKVLAAGAAGTLPPDGVAVFYGILGDKDLAFTWLDRAFRERRFYLVFLNVDPGFDALRLDARFAGLVRRVGIPS